MWALSLWTPFFFYSLCEFAKLEVVLVTDFAGGVSNKLLLLIRFFFFQAKMLL